LQRDEGHTGRGEAPVDGGYEVAQVATELIKPPDHDRVDPALLGIGHQLVEQ
jgi:hypothetical protein